MDKSERCDKKQIYKRWKDGESIEWLSCVYKVDIQVIENIIREYGKPISIQEGKEKIENARHKEVESEIC